MKDNGFGLYIPPVEEEGEFVQAMSPENYTLHHTVPGEELAILLSIFDVCGCV